MKPMQFKMVTGSTYAGFPGPVDQYGMMQLMGGCYMTFLKNEGKYDLQGIMIADEPVKINIACVQVKQELFDETDSAIAYCRYLGTLIASMEIDGLVCAEFEEYVNHIDPYFTQEFDGVGLRLAGRYDYAMSIGDENLSRKYLAEMQTLSRAYLENGLTEEQKTCQPNVVSVNFGSKKNASQEKDD